MDGMYVLYVGSPGPTCHLLTPATFQTNRRLPGLSLRCWRMVMSWPGVTVLMLETAQGFMSTCATWGALKEKRKTRKRPLEVCWGSNWRINQPLKWCAHYKYIIMIICIFIYLNIIMMLYLHVWYIYIHYIYIYTGLLQDISGSELEMLGPFLHRCHAMYPITRIAFP